jgi:hypothetical protein
LGGSGDVVVIVVVVVVVGAARERELAARVGSRSVDRVAVQTDSIEVIGDGSLADASLPLSAK